jgi:DNA-3-methyladenine glycosylase II
MTQARAASSNATIAKPHVEDALTKADPNLGRLIAAVIKKDGLKRIPRSKASPFESLVRAVVYQRMSAKAAATIYGKLRALSSGKLRPETLLGAGRPKLKAAGLSDAKLEYVRSLARWFIENPGRARRLSRMKDEEIVETLTSIPGIGLWTANVFLIFTLGRPDVMPANDLGIRKSVQLAYGLPRLASAAFVSEAAEKWRPFRSLASIYLWNAIRLNLAKADVSLACRTSRSAAP